MRKYKKSKPKNIYKKKTSKLINKLILKKKRKKKLILATQVGRGGGKWLCDILNTIENISAYGERNSIDESIFRYKRSHSIKSHDNKILKLIKTEALSDWERNDLSYISSPYFSHGISFLDFKLKPQKIVIIVASPLRVLTSLKNKGWYNFTEKIRLDKPLKKIPKKFKSKGNHFYGRMLNFDKYNKDFYNLTQIGKIILFMSQTIEKIYNELKKIKKRNIVVFHLDKSDQNYNYCKKFINKLGYDLKISKKQFLQLKKRTSYKFENKKISFNKNEVIEYKKYKKKYLIYLNKILKLSL
tara:strand:- start:339 stop:1235 length:897 start_codon:yes stop_codon:yes gene_type:complete